MKINAKVYLYVVLCILFWALIPVCSKKVLIGMNNISMMFFSNIISSVTMLAYIAYSKKFHIFKLYSVKDYFYMFFLGFLGSFLYYVFLYGAFSIASAQEVFIINYLWPILIVLLALFIFKEPLTLMKAISILISFLGVVIIATKGSLFSLDFSNIKGDVLAFLAALSFALFSVLGRNAKYDESIAVFIYFASSSVLSLFFIGYMNVNVINFNILFWLFVNGILANGISYVFWFFALKNGNIHIVSNSVYLTPFVSLLFIYILLKEDIHTYSFLALIFIISGIALQSLATLHNNKKSEIT